MKNLLLDSKKSLQSSSSIPIKSSKDKEPKPIKIYLNTIDVIKNKDLNENKDNNNVDYQGDLTQRIYNDKNNFEKRYNL